MVTIVDYKERVNSDGEPFNALILQGDIEMVKAETSGRYYATARRCSIPSTFNEVICKSLIGKTMPGSIVRKDAEMYDYTIPETGEVIQLTHTYEYEPVKRMEEAVFERDNGEAVVHQ